MDFLDVVQKRTSIRSFSDKKVDESTLREICRIGGLAPSINNYQPWRFIALTNKPMMSAIANAIADKIENLPDGNHEIAIPVKRQVEYFSTFFENAPAVIFIFTSPYESVLEKGVGLSHDDINRMRNYPDMQSVGACIENMLLGTVNLGLGACWMSSPLIAKEEIAKILNTENNLELAGLVAIGYQSKDIPPKTKKEIDTIFEFVP
jgi:nitroreductase